MGQLIASLIAMIFIVPMAIRATKRRLRLAGGHLHTLAQRYNGKLRYHGGRMRANRVDFVAGGIPFAVTLQDKGALEVHADVSSRIRSDLAVAQRWPAGPNLQHGRQKTHDYEFDSRVFIGGDPQVVAGLMNDQVRAVTRQNAGRGASIINGHLKVVLPAEVDIVASTEALLTWVGQLSTVERDLERDLTENALNDSLPDVRARNLQLLAPWADSNPETASRLASCLDAASENVRVAAGSTLRHQPTLSALAEDRACRLETRIEAVRALGSRVRRSEAAEALMSLATASQSARLVAEALEGLARHGALPSVETLTTLAATHPQGVSWQIARLLEHVAGPDVEAFLCELLEHDWVKTRARAAQSLGTVGSYRAVMPLRALTGFGASNEVKAAAEVAIERIQARLGPVDAGRLSMVEGHTGGELSVALSEGALSQTEVEGRGTAETQAEEHDAVDEETEASEVDA